MRGRLQSIHCQGVSGSVRCKGCNVCTTKDCNNPCAPPEYGMPLRSLCNECVASRRRLCKSCGAQKGLSDFETYTGAGKSILKSSCRDCLANLDRTKQECQSCNELKTKDTEFTRYDHDTNKFHLDCNNCERPKCRTCSNRAQEAVRSDHRDTWQCKDCSGRQCPMCTQCEPAIRFRKKTIRCYSCEFPKCAACGRQRQESEGALHRGDHRKDLKQEPWYHSVLL